VGDREMTSGNRDWAFNEATRRASVMGGAYSIYKHKQHPDYIIRTVEAAPPKTSDWERVATIEPNGSESFKVRLVL